MKERELPEGWEWKRLGDVGKIISGVTYKSDEASDEPIENYIPILRATNINGELDFNNLVFVPSERVSKEQFIRADDIVIAMSSGSKAIVGKTAQAKIDYKGSFGAFCAVFRCNADIDKKYVGLFFQTANYRALISHLSRGANINNLRKENFKSMLIPLPPLPIQRQIVAVLEQAEAVNRQRHEADALTGALLQSVFYEMFGDPLRNERGWEITTFGECCKSIRYGVGMPPLYTNEGIPFIRATNVKKGTIAEKNLKYVSIADSKTIEKCRITEGNLIVVRSGVNTGDCAYVPKKYEGALAGFDLIVEFNDFVSAHFFNFLINSDYGKSKINLLKRRAAQEHLNSDQLSSLKVPNPPLALQQLFARVVQGVERIREQQGESKREIDVLFDGLMAGTFSGELAMNEA